MVWMAAWWLTEAVDIEATALLPVVTFPLFGIAPLGRVLPPYAADIIFLFMGGFIIGLAIERWGVDRRLAFFTLRLVGARPGAIVGGFMLVTRRDESRRHPRHHRADRAAHRAMARQPGAPGPMIRATRRAAALALAVFALGPPVVLAQTATEPTRAEQPPATGPGSPTWRGEGEFVRSPNDAPLPPLPPPQQGLLETNFPSLREALGTLPPFFRDMDVNVRLRSFYFNRQNDNDTASEAWTLGGWVNFASGWLLDTFAIGGTYYTSLPAYAPADRPGSLLLTPGQGEIGVFGQAWAALRYKDYALLRGYRQWIDQGYVNPRDNRMVPNTFEAVTVSGTVDWAQYQAGYVANIKPRDSNNFVSMSSQAGAPGSDEGLILAALDLTPIENLAIYAGNYYAFDVFNTAFAKAEYTLPISADLKLQFGLQYTDQRSVGRALVGDFATWNVGAGMRVVWRGLTVGAATHFTGADASISSPWGTWPGYLSMLVTDFDRANEKAVGVGLRYDFGGSVLPFRIPGLSVDLAYVQGNDRIAPATGRAQPTTREVDLDVIYTVPGVKGLSLRFRNGYVSGDGPSLLKDFRIIVNYELDLL